MNNQSLHELNSFYIKKLTYMESGIIFLLQFYFYITEPFLRLFFKPYIEAMYATKRVN